MTKFDRPDWWRSRKRAWCIEALQELEVCTARDVIAWQVNRGYHLCMCIREVGSVMNNLVKEGKVSKDKKNGKDMQIYRWIQ